jgi:hypothetical protein
MKLVRDYIAEVEAEVNNTDWSTIKGEGPRKKYLAEIVQNVTGIENGSLESVFLTNSFYENLKIMNESENYHFYYDKLFEQKLYNILNKKFMKNLFENYQEYEVQAQRVNNPKYRNLNEAIQSGLSKNQYLFDRKVVSELKDISESAEDYYNGLNNYYISQADAAYEAGHPEVADYYARKIRG